MPASWKQPKRILIRKAGRPSDNLLLLIHISLKYYGKWVIYSTLFLVLESLESLWYLHYNFREDRLTTGVLQLANRVCPPGGQSYLTNRESEKSWPCKFVGDPTEGSCWNALPGLCASQVWMSSRFEHSSNSYVLYKKNHNQINANYRWVGVNHTRI